MDGERASPDMDDVQTLVSDLSVEEADESIINTLERIERNAGVKGGKPTVVRSVTSLDPVVRHFGLAPEQLTRLLDVILSAKLDDTTARKFIKLLLPRQSVPEMCAIQILGVLGKKLSFAIQATLLRWVILVYDIFDSRTKLQQLYGVAFHYLPYETLRPSLCHLLYYLTRREDVRPFRIRKLLDLQITVGKEPALAGLLHVYKSYFPDLILAPLTLTTQTIFKCPDQTTAEAIATLQTKWSHFSANQSFELNGSKDPISRSGAKRQKLSHSSIPDAFSIYRKGGDDKALPLSQITSLDSLVGHIDTLALPDQLASVLSNRLLQHVLCLQPSHSIVDRISYWLGQELMDLWYWSAKSDVTRARLTNILSNVVQVTKMIKDLLPVIENFLVPYLRVWNGVDHQKEIFTLLTFLRPRSYEELFAHFLKPLQRLFYLMGPVWKGQLILCYTRLVQNWAQVKWKDFLELGKDPLLSKQGSEELRRLFSELAPNVDYMQSIRAFVKHVDSVSGVALEMERDHIAVQHAVLSFFDFTSNLTKNSIPIAVIIPEAAIIYRCFLSDSAMAISRICGIVYQYKQAYEAFEDEQQLQYEILVQSQIASQGGEGETSAILPAPLEVPGYTREYVVQFNSFVMDICNFLWRNRAFNKVDKNAKGFQMDQETIAHTKQVCVDSGLSMNNMLSITHSTAFSGYSARFLKSLEEQSNIPVDKRLKAPASAKALKDMSANGGLNLTFDEYRIQYLDHLEGRGFEGISQFLFDCITNLLQRKLQSQERQRELKELQQQQQQPVSQDSVADPSLQNLSLEQSRV
ncbi:hypothetical protein BGZ96_008489 [Linnemannia gamsii]|uniref:Mis6-domain-containing protein n=1 Tax=Linnemannia gamsii TaxID=64522 RepID=A0ABQ7JZ40_9FUNG|nr:hypothetical protein BGZ96_008489 [Linnemannia gamsii]